MSERIHMIMRLSDDGSVYATSPQAPGLIYGRQSLAEWRSGLQDVLSFYFERPGPFDVIEHHERHYEVEGRELVTRLAMDEHRDQRQAVYERIGQVLRVPGQAESLVSAVTNTVGETVYVCAVSSIAKEEGTHPAWSVGSSAPDTRLSEIIREIPVVTPPHAIPLEVA